AQLSFLRHPHPVKNPAPKTLWTIVVVLLISLSLLSCERPSYLAFSVDPVDRFKDLVPFEAKVERIEVGQKPSTGVMIFLRTAVGERRVLVGSTKSPEMISFVQTLR